MKKISLFEILITFAKIGAITFGGGYAIFPIFEREIVTGKHWATKEELLDYYAIGQSIPGLIAVNVSIIITSRLIDSTYPKGSKRTFRRIITGITACLGIIIPSIIIILIIAALLSGFRENEYVQHALSGILICVLALIVSSVIKLWKNGIKDIPQLLICLITLALSIFTGISPIICLLLGAACGLLINIIMRRKSS